VGPHHRMGSYVLPPLSGCRRSGPRCPSTSARSDQRDPLRRLRSPTIRCSPTASLPFADPPFAHVARRLLLPWFSHHRWSSYEHRPRPVQSHWSTGSIDHGRPIGRRTMPSRSPTGGRRHAGFPILSDTFTGWVRDASIPDDRPPRTGSRWPHSPSVRRSHRRKRNRARTVERPPAQ